MVACRRRVEPVDWAAANDVQCADMGSSLYPDARSTELELRKGLNCLAGDAYLIHISQPRMGAHLHGKQALSAEPFLRKPQLGWMIFTFGALPVTT